MDATQMISDSILESDEDETEEENENKRGKPLAKLCILKNDHIPERELPLFLGENVLGRDPNTCTLSLPSPSISKQHATVSISVYRRRGHPSEADVEALVWDLGSLNGTRKGRLKLTPNVRYALAECDSLVLADIPCQYVSSSADRASPQDQFKTPMSRSSKAKATLAGASNENGSGNKKCVNGASESRVGLPAVEDRGETPVRSCLSFEQTPTQPQGTLVPESDLDSDDEGGRGDWRHKTLASNSDSSKVTPTSSTLLSPLNKTVPESEDESPITPPDSAKNRPYRYVGFTKEETDANVGRQELKERDAFALVSGSEEEEEEEGAAPEGRKSVESGHPVPVNKDGNVSLEGADESPVSASAVFPNAIPAFNMDSDTDVEGEEEGVPSALPVTSNTSQQADHPSETAQFHMDSDTDVDESDEKCPESVPPSDSGTKPSHVVPVIQPEDISMDSDTDMEDEAVSKAEPVSFQSTHADNVAATTQPKDFNLDSDTDADEEHENEEDQTPSRLDAKPFGTKPAPTALPIRQTDSETDDEAVPAPANAGISAVTETCTTADTRADLEILSDSDTDVKDDSPEVVPIVATTLSFTPGAVPGAVQSESDVDTDVDESSGPPAGGRVIPAGFHMDCETDAEDEADVGATAENQVPDLQREDTPGFLVPPLQKCSTPVQLLAGEMDRMETQDFLSPSSAPFRCAESPATRSIATASCSDSQEDESLVVAETQSFVLQARGSRSGFSDGHIMNPAQGFDSESSVDEGSEKSVRGASFQLGLSDSSHLQDRAQALAMESTQAFVPVDETGAHAATSHPERVSSDNGLSEDATQAYVEDEEPPRCPVTTQREGQVDLALEATQAYISDLRNDSEDETDEDETKNIACVETQAFELPTSSTLAMAETLPMCVLEEEGSLNDTEDGKAVPSLDEAQTQPIAQTQPMLLSDDEGINVEDSVPVLRKRKAKPLHFEDEQTQPLASCELALVETQPMLLTVDETMDTSGNDDDDEEDSIPVSRRKKTKPLQLQDEETQTLTGSDVTAETQPMVIGEDEESDDEGSIIGLRKRKAKPLQTQEEESQTLSLTAGETQPTATDEDGESEEVDSVAALRKRKAKPLHFEDEQTQPLASCELALVETQPMLLSVDKTMDTSGNDDDDDEEDSIPVARRKKTKPLQIQDEETQTLTGSDVTAETQPMVTGEDEESDDEGSIIGLRKRKAKPLQTQEEESQTLSLTAGETQPTATDEDGESEDVFPGLHKRKARPLQIQEDSQSLPHSGVSTSETQLSDTNTVCQRGHGGQTDAENSGVTCSRGVRSRLRTEKELTECAESPKRQMRENTRSTEKSRPCENESGEEEEEGEQKKQARGQSEKKNDEEEENKLSQNGSLVKEQEAAPEQKDVSDLRQGTERTDEERRQMDEREKKLEESQQRREEQENLKREKKEREEEKEKMVAKHAEISKNEKERAEKETIERKRKEEEDKERTKRMKREKEEQLLRNKKEKEDKERLEFEKAEREQKERLEREEKARKEKEEKDRLQAERRKQEEKPEREEEEPEPQVSLQSEAKAQEGGECSERDKQENDEKAIEEQQENKPTVPPRGRRAARRTVAALCAAEPQQDSTNDDVPARRTRSRSNSSNSVSSERSAASLDSQQSKGRGRGRGRGAKRTSEPPSAVTPRSSSRRKTVAARPAGQDGSNISQGALSRSNSSNSINSDLSSASLSSRGRGRGGRQCARGRQAEADAASLISDQSDQSPAPKPKGRNRRSNKAEESSVNASCGEEEEKTDSQQAATTRGRWRASSDGSEPASNENPLHQDERGANKSSPAPKRKIRARSQKEMKSETTEAEVSPSGSHEAEAGEKRRGRKRVSEANTEEAAGSKMSKGTVREQTVAEEDEEAKGQPQDEIPVQANRGGRAAISQTKKSAKGSPAGAEVRKDDVRTAEPAVGRRVRGRSSVARQKKKDEQEGSNSSVDQDACAVKPEQPQTPASGASRKRRAPADSSPAVKTPRSSSSSPAASGQSQSSCQTYKVLFTGVVDEAGERVLGRLGGSMAKGVTDMNCLVTDKVRRTVKFLCALAKGVPIVTTHWLEKSGKAGSFLSPASFDVKDPEQEKKFNFSLQESLRVASNQPLLQGYEVHVTKSVRPEPVHMKDILTCSGATFLPKMPTSHKPQTVVISCEEDWQLCGPALSASVPVVTAEFILTGILQQKLDVQTHSLSAPANIPQPVGGRGRGRKKT